MSGETDDKVVDRGDGVPGFTQGVYLGEGGRLSKRERRQPLVPNASVELVNGKPLLINGISKDS